MPQPTPATDGYFATRFSFDPGRAKVWRAICEYLQRYVRPTDTVLDLGTGYADFINHIRAGTRIAVDLNPDCRQHCAPDVRFQPGSAADLAGIGDESVDVVFASNLLEHLDDGALEAALREVRRVLRGGGMLILLQPNYRYAYREYFDDYTHRKVFSDVSLADLLAAHQFIRREVHPRFLPLSMKTRLPKSYWLTKLYLILPELVRPFAKQMLLVFSK